MSARFHRFLAGLLPFAVLGGAWAAHGDAIAPLPQRLSETGLYAPGTTDMLGAGHLAFTPQYPLWSDGASKRRWLSLPPGTAIDAADPNAWVFPRGTRLWKEFALGRRVETRMIERLADGSWRYATYVWNEAGTDALLAPAGGIRLANVPGAPGGIYVVPGEADCRACHEGAAVPVLGAGALQLSPERDPLAPHGEAPRTGDVDLRTLVARGLLVNLPPALVESPPRIPARSAVERAAVGYLHGNCGHCHNAVDSGAGVPVSLLLAHDVLAPQQSVRDALAGMLERPSRVKPPGMRQPVLVAAGDAGASVLAVRMRSRAPALQMPPLGTQVADPEGIALIERWINHSLKEKSQ
jgi:hypothetical protein